MKIILVLGVIVIIFSGCSNENKSKTILLPETDLAQENEGISNDLEFVSKKIFKYEYQTMEKDNFQFGQMASAFLDEKDNHSIFVKDYDLDNNKTVYEKIDIRYGFHESYSTYDEKIKDFEEITVSPDGSYVFGEKKENDKRHFIIIDLLHNTETELLCVSSYDYPAEVYNMKAKWTEDSKKIIYVLAVGNYCQVNVFDYICVYDIVKQQEEKKISKFEIEKNSSPFSYWNLAVSNDGKKIILYGDSPQINLIDLSKEKEIITTILCNWYEGTEYVIKYDKIFGVTLFGCLYFYPLDTNAPEWYLISHELSTEIMDYVICNGGNTIIVAEQEHLNENDVTEKESEQEIHMYLDSDIITNIYSYSFEDGNKELLYKGIGNISNLTLSGDEKELLIELRKQSFFYQQNVMYDVEAIKLML